MKKLFFALLGMALQLPCSAGSDGNSLEIHEFVDLALPSRTKWATSNLGASKPEEIGGYYAWGEVATKENYSLDNYKWWDGNKFTKYCTDSEMGIVDNKMTLDSDDDAVRYNCGGNWRMPTRDDIQELKDNCSWEWAVVDSVPGYKVTGSNGNSIFLPAGGAFVGSEKLDEGFGYYWLASLDDVNYGDAFAYCLGVNYYDVGFTCHERSNGLQIRPVCDVADKGGKVAEKKYKITVSAKGNGSVSIVGESGKTVKVATGEKITVVAKGTEGSEFVGWYVRGTNEVVSRNASYTFAVDKNCYLVAVFKEVETGCSEYSVTLYCKGNGSVYVEGGNYLEVEDNSRVTEVLEKGREIAAVVSPAEGSEFVGWFREGSNQLVSKDMMYIFTVTEDIVLMALCVESEVGNDTPDKDLPVAKKTAVTDKRAVDLGLSVYWASCNIGADSPEENGTLFAWAETEEKSRYGWSNYKYCKNGDKYKITKYSSKVDKKNIVDPEDDAAHVNWGGGWRMPTSKEVRELFDKCIWKWTEVNGIPGYMVTGPNGNSIFLPVTSSGYFDKKSSQMKNESGAYWINECSRGNSDIAILMYISKKGKIMDGYHRHYGIVIRAVCE